MLAKGRRVNAAFWILSAFFQVTGLLRGDNTLFFVGLIFLVLALINGGTHPKNP